jgi:hypothetical protein
MFLISGILVLIFLALGGFLGLYLDVVLGINNPPMYWFIGTSVGFIGGLIMGIIL